MYQGSSYKFREGLLNKDVPGKEKGHSVSQQNSFKQKPNCLGSLFSLKSLNEMKGEPDEGNVSFFFNKV